MAQRGEDDLEAIARSVASDDAAEVERGHAAALARMATRRGRLAAAVGSPWLTRSLRMIVAGRVDTV